jgi:hypothetical protein
MRMQRHHIYHHHTHPETHSSPSPTHHRRTGSTDDGDQDPHHNSHDKGPCSSLYTPSPQNNIFMWATQSKFNTALVKASVSVARRRPTTLRGTITSGHLNHTAIAVSSFSSTSVEVEHGRGQWKTYGDVSSYKPGKHQIKCFNKISPVGLSQFPTDQYDIRPDGKEAANAHAILLRSHKLQEQDVPKTVRAIARCGAGTNNIPVSRMTELGIPVFNTPGANEMPSRNWFSVECYWDPAGSLMGSTT